MAVGGTIAGGGRRERFEDGYRVAGEADENGGCEGRCEGGAEGTCTGPQLGTNVRPGLGTRISPDSIGYSGCTIMHPDYSTEDELALVECVLRGTTGIPAACCRWSVDLEYPYGGRNGRDGPEEISGVL